MCWSCAGRGRTEPSPTRGRCRSASGRRWRRASKEGVQEHLAVDEGALKTPLPASLQGVLPDQEGARLSQREDPLVAAREVADVPVAGERLRVRGQGLA